MATSTLPNSSSAITRKACSSGYFAKQLVEQATYTAPSDLTEWNTPGPAPDPRRRLILISAFQRKSRVRRADGPQAGSDRTQLPAYRIAPFHCVRSGESSAWGGRI